MHKGFILPLPNLFEVHKQKLCITALQKSIIQNECSTFDIKLWQTQEQVTVMRNVMGNIHTSSDLLQKFSTTN